MKSNYKSHVLFCKEEVDRYIRDEWERLEQKEFEANLRDISAQLMAVCCMELNQEFHFGKDRLQRFKCGVEGLFKLMNDNGLMGKPFDTQSCIDYMRNKFGIDFDEKRNDRQ